MRRPAARPDAGRCGGRMRGAGDAQAYPRRRWRRLRRAFRQLCDCGRRRPWCAPCRRRNCPPISEATQLNGKPALARARRPLRQPGRRRGRAPACAPGAQRRERAGGGARCRKPRRQPPAGELRSRRRPRRWPTSPPRWRSRFRRADAGRDQTRARQTVAAPAPKPQVAATPPQSCKAPRR